MYVSGRWSTPGIIANADFNWNAAPLPEGPAGSSNWLFWGAYAVNAKTEHPEEAWELITRLTSAEIQGQIANLGANIPSRQTEAAIDLFLGTLPDSGVNNQAFVDGAAVGVTEAPLFHGDWPAIDQTYGTEITKVFNGEITPQDFADNICGMVEQYFDPM
jgi:multiple sugar transport system substrate-binding protein